MNLNNFCQFTGNLGRDPDVKILPSGRKLCLLSIATDHSYKNKDTGEWVDATEWHDVKAYGPLAEYLYDKLRKGDQVILFGEIRNNQWTDDEGKKHRRTYLLLNSFKKIEPRRSSQPEPDDLYSSGLPHKEKIASPTAPENSSGGNQPDDDGLPF